MAWQIATPLILFFSTHFSLITPTTSQNSPTLLGYDCSSFADNYTENSPYHSNLLNAFSNLTSLSSSNTFSHIFVGIREDGPNKVCALYNCRNDLSSETCHQCVEDAAKNLLQLCLPSKEAIALYEECMLRYANRPILSIMEHSPFYFECENGIPDEGQLRRTIEPIFRRLIDEATSENSSSYFAIGEGSYSEYLKVYCLMQCTPDLRRDQCRDCLKDTLNGTLLVCMPHSRLTGILIDPSCQMRYNILPFYNLSSSLPMASPPPLGSSFED